MVAKKGENYPLTDVRNTANKSRPKMHTFIVFHIEEAWIPRII